MMMPSPRQPSDREESTKDEYCSGLETRKRSDINDDDPGKREISHHHSSSDGLQNMKRARTTTTINDASSFHRQSTTADNNDPASSTSLTPLESFLVGLSPYFWSHIPMLIQQVHNGLVLLEGLHCLVFFQQNEPDGSEHDDGSVEEEQQSSESKQSASSTRSSSEPYSQPMDPFADFSDDLLSSDERSDNNQKTTSTMTTTKPHEPNNNNNNDITIHHARPISKCKLVGTIVAMERGAGGATIFVIDDGTGVVDCLYYNDNFEQDDESWLPPLLPSSNNNPDPAALQIGQLVTVFGRIDCACILKQDPSGSQCARISNKKTLSLYGKQWNVLPCRREIRASLIKPAVREVYHGHDDHYNGNNNVSRIMMTEPQSWQCDAGVELAHWKHVQQTHADIWRSAQQTDAKQLLLDCNPERQRQQDSTIHSLPRPKPYLDASHMRQLLGPRVGAEIANLTSLPAEKGTWQVFGRHCRCPETDVIKTRLLYCPCVAKRVALDPHGKYRTALLHRLLQLEDESQQNHATLPTNSGWNKEPIRFLYSALLRDAQLQRVAQQVLAHAGNQNGAPQLLHRKTIAALRDDNIVYLLDSRSDTYLLLSRERAIESFLLQQQRHRQNGGVLPERRQDSKNDNGEPDIPEIVALHPPVYWSRIPKAKIHHVRRLLQARQEEGAQAG